MQKIKAVRINKEIPLTKNKKGDAGYDMFCSKDTWIFPFHNVKVPLNIKVAIPEGEFGLVTSRSGESVKGNFVVPGILDSGYRGQVSAIMTRIGLLPRRIKAGTRIAQIVFIGHKEYVLEEVDELNATSRGEQGFGSTGIN